MAGNGSSFVPGVNVITVVISFTIKVNIIHLLVNVINEIINNSCVKTVFIKI